jgi:branched-chain amino acid transport system substrate-binding protein
MVQVLQQCGDDLTRDQRDEQAASLKDFETGMALPGIKINTSPTDFYPIEQMQMGGSAASRSKPFGPI